MTPWYEAGPGVHRTDGSSADVAADARSHGITPYVVEDIDEIDAVLRFPDWYGHNLDALADCLRDLSWLPEGPLAVICVRPPDRVIVEILAEAAEFSRSGARPLYALLLDPPTLPR